MTPPIAPGGAVDELVISAHGIVSNRSALPVPAWLAVYAAALVVWMSFFLIAAIRRPPGSRSAWPGIELTLLHSIVGSRATRVALRVLGLALLGALLTCAWFGPDDSGRSNPAPTWFYVWFWVGLVPLSLCLGPVWRVMNPARTLATLLARILHFRSIRLPARVGYWPAAAGIVAFVWLELVYDESASPRAVALFVTVYVLTQTAAGLVFGPRWFGVGDGFEAYATMLSRVSPLGRRVDGMLVLRNPLDGLSAAPTSPDLTPLVLLVLGSTAFDGLSRTTWWSRGVAGTGRAEYLLLGTTGLFVAVGSVVVSYGLAIRLMGGGGVGPGRITSAMAPSIIPIAVGYTIAHYFAFAVFQGQQGVLLANDPLVRGSNLLGLRGVTADYTVVSGNTIALVEIGAIVIGHIVAVISAHDRAVTILAPRKERTGQYPMLAVMVAYTAVGIALLSST